MNALTVEMIDFVARRYFLHYILYIALGKLGGQFSG